MNAIARFIAYAIIGAIAAVTALCTLAAALAGFILLPIYVVGRARQWWRVRTSSKRKAAR